MLNKLSIYFYNFYPFLSYIILIKFQIDAFTDEAFKGNPAAVCILEENVDMDEQWMLSVAKEFNISETCYLTRVISANGFYPNSCNQNTTVPRFGLRWFTPVAEVSFLTSLYLYFSTYLLATCLLNNYQT